MFNSKLSDGESLRLDPSQPYRAVEVMKSDHVHPYFQFHNSPSPALQYNSMSGRSLDDVISKESCRMADA